MLFWCICVSLCTVTQINEIDYLVLWVHVTKNFVFCQCVKRKEEKCLYFPAYYHLPSGCSGNICALSHGKGEPQLISQEHHLVLWSEYYIWAHFLALFPHGCFKTGAQMHLQHLMHVHNQKHWFAVNNSCQLGHLVLIMRSQGLGSFQMIYEIFFAVSHSHWQVLS